jgi:hypothetical protein
MVEEPQYYKLRCREALQFNVTTWNNYFGELEEFLASL